MNINKVLARVFFAGAVSTMLVSAFHVRGAQAQDSDEEAPRCADGNRKLCKSGPLMGGGTYYNYWV